MFHQTGSGEQELAGKRSKSQKHRADLRIVLCSSHIYFWLRLFQERQRPLVTPKAREREYLIFLAGYGKGYGTSIALRLSLSMYLPFNPSPTFIAPLLCHDQDDYYRALILIVACNAYTAAALSFLVRSSHFSSSRAQRAAAR